MHHFAILFRYSDTIRELVVANWADLLVGLDIVVMGILTYFLVRINGRQANINELGHTARLQSSRVRPVDDGVDKIEMRLSNSGAGAVRDITAIVDITNLIVRSRENSESTDSGRLRRAEVSKLPQEEYDIKPTRHDLNRVFSSSGGNESAEDTDSDPGKWIPTAGNNLQGNETDVLFNFIADIHMNEESDDANIRTLLRKLSGEDLDGLDLRGIEFEIELQYDAEIAQEESLTVLEFVIPVQPNLTLKTAMEKGMRSEEFDTDPSRLLVESRLG